MKTLLIILSLFTGSAYALPRTVLQCTIVEQVDIRNILVTEPAKDRAAGLMTMTLIDADGEPKDIEITEEDYNQGWIALPDFENIERYLIRQADGWEIFGMHGDKNLFFPANCVE